MWFDSHCHLHLCEPPAGALLDAARSAGVDGVVTIGIDARSSRAARDLASQHEIWFSAGVHPNQAGEWTDSRQDIESLLDDARCVALGETGLDFYRMGAAREIQHKSFADHIELAKNRDKALVVHTRESVAAALDVIEAMSPPERLVFHCWSGTGRELERALSIGAYISFAGNVSFPSAGDLRDAARLVPSDRLLVETDSPYLSPVPRRGRPNEPANLPHVGAAVAESRGEPVDDVAATSARNAARLFGV